MELSLIDDLNREIATIRKQATAASAVVRSTKARNIAKLVEGFLSEDFGHYSYIAGGSANFNLWLSNLEGFKDTRLLHILSAFEYENPDINSTTDSAQFYQRAYEFVYYVNDKEGFLGQVRVVVNAVIKNDSETCERVVVGMTAPAPQPIYKLVCDGQEMPEVVTLVEGE